MQKAMTWRPLLGALLVVWLLPLSARAQEATAADAPTPPQALPSVASSPATLDPPLRFTLPNGLQVVLQRDPRKPRVAISVVYAVGAGNDPAGYRGLAHLVEHLMFEGSSDRVTSDFFENIEAAGTTGVNGTTSSDHTSYFHELPRAFLDLGLWLEASRMAYLLRWLDAKDLDRARIAVIREWESHVESNGRAGMQAVISRALYPEGHPYHHAHDDPEGLEAVTSADVQWFFQRWYGPDRATLAVAGDFDVEATRGTVERLFGSIVGSPSKDEPAKVVTPALTGAREIEMVWSSSHPMCSLTWLVPPTDAQSDLTLDAVSEYLDLELEALVADDADLERAGASYREHVLSGEFGVHWSTDEQSDGTRERAAIMAIVDMLRGGKLKPQLVARARERIRRSYLFSEADLIGRSLRLAHPERDSESWNATARAERVAAITAEQMHAAALRFLPRDAQLLVCARHKDGAPAFGKVSSDEMTRKVGKP